MHRLEARRFHFRMNVRPGDVHQSQFWQVPSLCAQALQQESA